MREKELRLALVCYGGISLAVYMHGITKEIWHLARASRDFTEPHGPYSGSYGVYRRLLAEIGGSAALRIRVVPDIIAGASAGGINGIFLAQAIHSGQSLEPLTDLWLARADVDQLLDPDARPAARFSKFWATPLVWMALRWKSRSVDATVARETRSEVRRKLSRFVRSRWFAPPFGGPIFTGLLFEALDSMAASVPDAPLLPATHPLDLMVTVTDFQGYPQLLRLNSPPQVVETEHRLTIDFRARDRQAPLAAIPELVFSARATASFPGAFPPLGIGEMDRYIAETARQWPGRDRFLARVMPRRAALGTLHEAALIDGSVLSNAPFAPAIGVLKNRPSRREVDRRFVYIDPTPASARARRGEGRSATPGFFRAILGSLSDIPREQPIRDNLDAIEERSREIRRMRRITVALREEIEQDVEAALGKILFLSRPTPTRLSAWRAKAHKRSALAAGFAYPAYAHVKLSGVAEDLAELIHALRENPDPKDRESVRQAVWAHLRSLDVDQIRTARKGDAREEIVGFFREHDLRFRIRRLHFVVRQLNEALERDDATPPSDQAVASLRESLYGALSLYQHCEAHDHYDAACAAAARDALDNPAGALAEIARNRDLGALDLAADKQLASAIAALPDELRRTVLLTYLGFPFYDVATLPLLQGEGLEEFDPIKVDRISPDDCNAIRDGGADATLRGIEFNNFGAFFSRAYRENDYLWGRLHGAERLVDLLLSTVPRTAKLRAGLRGDFLRQAFHAILDEEAERLPTTRDLIAGIREEIAARAAS